MVVILMMPLASSTLMLTLTSTECHQRDNAVESEEALTVPSLLVLS
jgi:hypothetical protein